MRAAVLDDGALEIRDLPVPECGNDEVVVRISAAGVCHSDLHLVRGDWAGVPRSGRLGHEATGVVETLGPGADRYVAIGDRVILGLGGTGGGYWCGACDHCLAGRLRLCAQGRPLTGAFAEYLTCWAPALVTLPESVGDLEAPLACGGLTAFGAVKKLLAHQVQPGRPIAVVGAAGGLGHYAVQLANAFGYQVVGVDIGEERLEMARSFGADLAVGPDEAVAVVDRTFGGVDAALVFSSSIAGFHLGLQILRPGGIFVAVGLPPTAEGNLELSPFELFAKDLTLISSAVGTVQDMRELVLLASRGLVRTHVARTAPLSGLPMILDDLERSSYVGRAVIDRLDT